mgnify:CR=1 FL=1
MATIVKEVKQEFVERARAFVPVLRERAAETDAIRKIPESTIQELKNAGLLTLLRPKMYGGQQLNIRTFMECAIEIARGCASTGWIFSLCNIREYMIAASFTEKAHDEIFGSGKDVLFAGVNTPKMCQVKKVDGGYLIEDSFYPLCSGSLHATWGYFGMPLVDEQGNVVDTGLITIPFEQVEVIDDWFALGLRGTGSNSVKLKNVFVPEHRAVSFTQAASGNFLSKHLRHIPLYNTALFPVMLCSLGITGLGAAMAAMDMLTEKLKTRKVLSLGVEYARDATLTHHQVAQIAFKIETAAMHMYRLADDLDSWAASGKYMPPELRSKALAHAGYANQMCSEVFDIVKLAYGSSCVYDNDPLQRVIRDFETAYVHPGISPVVHLENYGRILCGLESNSKAI